MFAEDDNGKKINCPHPGEESRAKMVLGIDGTSQELNKKTAKNRVGLMANCVCMDCANRLDLEIDDGESIFHDDDSHYIRRGRDERKCNKCSSKNVVTMLEVIGLVCPKCKKGHIIEEDTGTIS
ncbi:MAG: hypothetical protein WCP93_00025 [Candidatus Berkelbacteria bacterium]